MSLQRSNTNKSSDNTQQVTSQANHFLQRAVKVMKQLTQAQKSMKGLQNQIKIKKLIEINKNLQQAVRKDAKCISVLVQNKVLIYIKHFFTENVTKGPALAFLRLLIPSLPNSSLYLSHNIPLLVAKVLERQDNRQRNGDWEDEASEALKLIAEWIENLSEGFPRILGTSLVCFAELPAILGFQEKKKDHITQHLKLLAVDVILALTAKKLDLSLEIGAFTFLVNCINDYSVQERSQDILIRILYFMNERQSREKIWNYVDLKKLFGVFTDLDYVFFEQNNKNKGNIDYCSRLQTNLSLSKQSLLTLLKSWTGMIVLANQEWILNTILQALKQIPKKQDSQVRKIIYSMLEEILSVGQGLLGGQFVQLQNEFRASSLLSAYMITLLRLLMDHGLFNLLIELSGIDEPSIAQPAQKLLRKLSIYIFNFLPDAANYMDFLITAGTKTSPGSSVLKYSSSFIVNKIGNFVFDDHKQTKNSFLGELEHIFNLDTIFMPINRLSIMSISKNLNFLAYKQVPNYRRKLLDLKPIPKQHKQNFKKWDWSIIVDLLSFPDVQKDTSKPDSNDKYKQFKLYKYLLRFYTYSRGNFAEQKWSIDNFIYIKSGKLLIQNTLLIPDNLVLVKNPPQSQFEFTISFIGQLQKLLQNTLQNFGKHSTKYYAPFFKNLQRQLVLWIGSFTHTKVGYEALICQNHFFEILQNYIPKKQCSFVISGIMFELDFYRDNLMKRYKNNGQQQTYMIGPTVLLAKCVKEGSKSLKLMSIQIIKLLYKVELSIFTTEGMKLLLQLSLQNDLQVWNNAIQTIQALIKNRQLLQKLLSMLIQYQRQNKDSFAVLRNRLTSQIYIRLCQLEEGFKFVDGKLDGLLQRQYAKWMKPEASEKYFNNLELLLNNSLNFNNKNYTGYKFDAEGKDFPRWAFLYKLPWIININEGEQVPLLMKLTHQNLLLYSQLTEEQYEFRTVNAQNILKVCLSIGSIYLDQDLNPSKTKCFVPINLNINTLVTLYGQQYYCASSNGVCVYFLLRAQGQSMNEMSESDAYACSYDIRRIHVNIKLTSYYSNEELPIHLIQYITKTEQGLKFLEDKFYTEHSINILSSPESQTMQIRSVLWSLGYYGSTKEGMKRLIKEKIVEMVLDLSVKSGTLSIRGTCRYVLNMMCHSQEGRNYLSLHGLTINKRMLSCSPKNSKQIYELNDHPDLTISQKQDFWSDYNKSLSTLNQNQAKLFESICLLINSLSSKYAISQIKEIIKNHSKITFSFPLLQNVINLMSYFKMKYEPRKTIHFIFDDFLKSNQFMADGVGNLNYPTKR